MKNPEQLTDLILDIARKSHEAQYGALHQAQISHIRNHLLAFLRQDHPVTFHSSVFRKTIAPRDGLPLDLAIEEQVRSTLSHWISDPLRMEIRIALLRDKDYYYKNIKNEYQEKDYSWHLD